MKFNPKLIVTVFTLIAAFATSSSFAESILKKEKDSVAKGKVVYTTNCATCHGDLGDGNGVAGAALNPKPRDFTAGEFKQGGMAKEIFETVTNGFKANPVMTSFKHLSVQDRSNVVYYVMSLKTAKGKKK